MFFIEFLFVGFFKLFTNVLGYFLFVYHSGYSFFLLFILLGFLGRFDQIFWDTCNVSILTIGGDVVFQGIWQTIEVFHRREIFSDIQHGRFPQVKRYIRSGTSPDL
ncbi:hypothetical protein D9M71_708900 [compost metagenome]